MKERQKKWRQKSYFTCLWFLLDRHIKLIWLLTLICVVIDMRLDKRLSTEEKEVGNQKDYDIVIVGEC